MATPRNIRSLAAALFAAMLFGAAGCIPPVDRFEHDSSLSNTTYSSSTNTTQILDFAQSPVTPKQAVRQRDTDVTRMRELKLQIEEKKAELRSMKKALADLKQLRAAVPGDYKAVRARE